MRDIDREGARFKVICKRCNRQYNVIRNWGGGIRRADLYVGMNRYNPAICDCGSRQLELY